MLAERETTDRLIAHFLADRIGATFEGRISGVTRAGLFVKLRDTGADGFVPARTIGDEYFRYDESAPCHGRPSHAAKPTGSAIRSPSSWSRPRRSPARCASSSCPKAVASRPGPRRDRRRSGERELPRARQDNGRAR